MKRLIYIVLIFFSINISAQTIKKNMVGTGVYYVFDKTEHNLNMYSFTYQRHIGLGLNILFQYSKAQGGKMLSSIIKKSDVAELNYYHILGYGDKDIGKTMGEYIQFHNYGVGLNKEVKMAKSIFLNFSISGIYTVISRTRIADLKYDSESKLIIDEFYSTYSSTNYWGVKPSFGINYKIKEYLKIGTSVGYITKPQFFVVGVNTSVIF